MLNLDQELEIPELHMKFQDRDALFIIDVQKDFCPGGALPIPEGDRVVEYLNHFIKLAVSENIPIYYTRDFHPLQHPSFESQGGPWPKHCIQGTEGADFHKKLYLAENAVIVTKGVRLDQDQNSAFEQTGLAIHLEKKEIQRLWVGGLALDVCVLATVLDALNSGWEVVLLCQGTKPVTRQGGDKALEKMKTSGADFFPKPPE